MIERRKDSTLFAGKMFLKETFYEKKSILKSKVNLNGLDIFLKKKILIGSSA